MPAKHWKESGRRLLSFSLFPENSQGMFMSTMNAGLSKTKWLQEIET